MNILDFSLVRDNFYTMDIQNNSCTESLETFCLWQTRSINVTRFLNPVLLSSVIFLSP